MFDSTLKSAIEYSRKDNIEEWIHEYLCGEGGNKGFSDGLKLEKRQYEGPILTKLHLLQRTYGPESHLQYSIPEGDEEQIRYFWKGIDAIADRYKTGAWDMPPLIVNGDNGIYEINDGNHRYEALKKLGVDEYWVIFWKT